MDGRTVMMPSETTNTIHQHCSVCKADFDMDVIKQGSTEDVLWLKCPGCQGFLPYMPKEDLTDGEDRVPDEQNVALEDLDVEHAKEYTEDQEYQIGEVLHHRSWHSEGRREGQTPGQSPYDLGSVHPTGACPAPRGRRRSLATPRGS
jgi:hypothetical protein